MKILLTGKDGQLGFELRRALSVLGEVVAVSRQECDLANPAAIRALVRTVAPTVIVNAAAYTAVDAAEKDEVGAFSVNATAPEILAQEAALLGAVLVHFSTDYVFDGSKDGPYVEQDIPNPQNVYGASKLAGELAIAKANLRHFIFRTSWVVGAHGGNFAKTMLRLASERSELRVVADQTGAPTSAALLADVTAHVLHTYSRDNAQTVQFGTYHVAAGGDTNWCEYARFVLTAASERGKVLKVGPDAVIGITSDQFPTPARRPKNSRLSAAKFEAVFGLRLPQWQEGLGHVLEQILDEN